MADGVLAKRKSPREIEWRRGKFAKLEVNETTGKIEQDQRVQMREYVSDTCL